MARVTRSTRATRSKTKQDPVPDAVSEDVPGVPVSETISETVTEAVDPAVHPAVQSAPTSSFVADKDDPAQRTDENIFLFAPNLIGYARIVLAIVALKFMPYHPKYSTVAYVVSCLLDAADGYAARYLDQTSNFGAILDMITDRCTTASLICFLTSAYPSWTMTFQFLVALDFASHYLHMYATLYSGSVSHKSVTKETSRILYSYYHNRITLFSVCAGNELFFVALYLAKFYRHTLGIDALLLHHVAPAAYAQLPPLARQVLVNLSWPQLLAAATFPVFALKQFINGVQIVKASYTLVHADQHDRWLRLQAKSQ